LLNKIINKFLKKKECTHPSRSVEHNILITEITYHSVQIIHSKQCWVVLTQILVKCGQTQMLG